MIPATLKEKELRALATCGICHDKVMSTGLPLFWRVTIDRFGIDTRAMQRQQGLSMMMGSPALAMFMGPNEDMAKPVMDTAVVSVCENCATGSDLPIAAIAEIATFDPSPEAA